MITVESNTDRTKQCLSCGYSQLDAVIADVSVFRNAHSTNTWSLCTRCLLDFVKAAGAWANSGR